MMLSRTLVKGGFAAVEIGWMSPAGRQQARAPRRGAR
jgi:hypothetical protein